MTILGDPTLHPYDYIYGLNEIEGYPKKFKEDPLGSNFIDLDLDGIDEILTYGENGLTLYEMNGLKKWEYVGNDVVSKPAIGDIDNDGKLEIVAGFYCDPGSEIIAFSNTGTLIFSKSTNALTSSPVIFDFNNDGYKEIIYTQNLSFEDGYKSLIVLNHSGRELWSHSTGALAGQGVQPSVGKVKNDSKWYLIWCLDNHEMGGIDKIYAYYFSKEEGSFKELWSKSIEGIGQVSPSLGDARDMGREDIIAGSSFNVLSEGIVYVLDGQDGNTIDSYSIDSIPLAPILVNLDDDPYLELIASSFNYSFHVFPDVMSEKGNYIKLDLPLRSSTNPCIANITGNEEPELFLPTYRGIFAMDRYCQAIWENRYFGKKVEFKKSIAGLAIKERSDCVIHDFDGDGKAELGYGDFFGNVHILPLNTTINNYSWLEGRADRWNTGNTTDRVPPIPPHGLTSDAEQSGQGRWIIHLDWDDNKDLDFEKYYIYERISGMMPYTLIDSSTTSSYDRTIYPDPEEEYFYYVKAVDNKGNVSSRSNSVKGYPEFGGGLGLDYEVNVEYIDLGKKESSPYLIKRDGYEKHPEIDDFIIYPDFDIDYASDTVVYRIPPEYAGGYMVLTLNSGHYLVKTGINEKEIEVAEEGNIYYFNFPSSANKDIDVKVISLDSSRVEVSEMYLISISNKKKTETTENAGVIESLVTDEIKVIQRMDRLTIEKSVEKQDDWRVELFDITGRKVLTRNLSGDIRKSVINTSEYPSGVYFLNITGSVKAFTKLMIVK